MRKFYPVLLGMILVFGLIAFPKPAHAKFQYHHNGLALGIGVNQASENNADESFAFGLKYRHRTMAMGLDYCMSEGPGGEGNSSIVFAWYAWMEEFSRPEESTYDLYAGLGAGYMLLEDEDLMDSPWGPFFICGWDLGEELTLEGKVGIFGENKWGIAMLYWNM